jgi:hypothetical protein
MLGQPERNRNYSEGDIWETWQHMICAASEIAAARIMGFTDFEPHANTFKTVLDIPGYEVRYSFTGKSGDAKYALRFKEGVDDPTQMYILIVGGPEEKTRRSAEDGYVTPPFRALGWKLGADMIDESFRAPYGKNNYRVTPWDLNEMATLPVVEAVQ